MLFHKGCRSNDFTVFFGCYVGEYEFGENSIAFTDAVGNEFTLDDGTWKFKPLQEIEWEYERGESEDWNEEYEQN